MFTLFSYFCPAQVEDAKKLVKFSKDIDAGGAVFSLMKELEVERGRNFGGERFGGRGGRGGQGGRFERDGRFSGRGGGRFDNSRSFKGGSRYEGYGGRNDRFDHGNRYDGGASGVRRGSFRDSGRRGYHSAPKPQSHEW